MVDSRVIKLVLFVALACGSLLRETLATPLPPVAGLVFHLDADNSSTVTADGFNRVSQWNDTSTSTNHATSSGLNRPLYVTGAWDGGVGLSRDVIRFATGTDEIMTTLFNSPYSGNGFGITVFTVFKLNSAVGNFSSIVSQSPGTAGQGMSFLVGANQGGRAFTDQWGPDGARATNVVPIGGDGQIVTWSVSSWLNHDTATQIFYDGVAEAVVPYNSIGTPSLTANPFRVGNWDETRPSDDMVFPSDIGEILIYNGALSTSDRQSIEAYLDAKWFQVQPVVPEPSSFLLLGLGALGMMRHTRRRRRRA